MKTYLAFLFLLILSCSPAANTNYWVDQFNSDGVIFAILPKCLQAGDNPEDFSSGQFPVYNGPNAPSTITADMIGGIEYSAGVLTLDGTDDLLKTNWRPQAGIPAYTMIAWFTTTNDGGSRGTLISNRDKDDSERGPLLVQMNDGALINILNEGGINQPERKYIIFPAFSKRDSVDFSYNNGQDMFLSLSWTRVGDYFSYNVNGSKPTVSGVEYQSVANYNITKLDTPQIDLAIGASTDDQGSTYYYHWNGTITGLILYSRSLSDAEITQVYSLGDDLGGVKGINNEDGTLSLYWEPNHSVILDTMVNPSGDTVGIAVQSPRYPANHYLQTADDPASSWSNIDSSMALPAFDVDTLYSTDGDAHLRVIRSSN